MTLSGKLILVLAVMGALIGLSMGMNRLACTKFDRGYFFRNYLDFFRCAECCSQKSSNEWTINNGEWTHVGVCRCIPRNLSKESIKLERSACMQHNRMIFQKRNDDTECSKCCVRKSGATWKLSEEEWARGKCTCVPAVTSH